MRKYVAVIMSTLVVATIASVAFAQSDRGGDDRLERMASRLGLDETQKQQIENIHLAAQPEIDALEEQMKALREARQAVAERIRGEVDAVLTDEQRSKLDEGRAARDGRRGPAGAHGRPDKRIDTRRQMRGIDSPTSE
ncbi:MAG: Spy/CpxP family protein refolding chaperone [Gammaproteobacteria bacterium]|nr:Spy/CpxP family protein refolding chaperone [Gammaproteobacteria bacterium]